MHIRQPTKTASSIFSDGKVITTAAGEGSHSVGAMLLADVCLFKTLVDVCIDIIETVIKKKWVNEKRGMDNIATMLLATANST